jgi:hypothetical protein
MPSVNFNDLPELAGDDAIQSLIDTFNARIVYAETETQYIGNMTATVQVGEDEFITLPTVRLMFACHKAELERARATMFATYLLEKGRETAIDLWKRAAPWEGKRFMEWVRLDIQWKRANQEAAAA